MSATRTILAAVRSPALGDDATDAELLRRFTETRDEAAFEAIVRRHARLVWGVCHRILGHVQDAEDAFQATFLELARNPEKPRKWGTTTGFLFGVARRVAMKARVGVAARSARPLFPSPAQPQDPATGAAVRELQAILDEEIGRLPESYRVAFLLCVLEGRSRAEAAAELRVNEGTLSARLARARLLLRERLAKRGVQLAAAVAVADLTSWGSAAPLALVGATVAAGVSGRGTLAVAALVSGLRGRIALGTAVGLVVCTIVAAGLAIGVPASSEKPPPPASEKPKAERPAATDSRGDLLPAGAVAQLGSSSWRHEGEGKSMSFSPDGKILAVLSGEDGVITFFETASGKVVHRLPTPADPLLAVVTIAFSPDGKSFACRLGDGTIQLRDPQTKKLVRTLTSSGEHDGGGGSGDPIAFSSDGKFLAVTTRGLATPPVVTIWDVAQGKPSTLLEGHKHGNPALVFSPDGKIVFLGAANPNVQLWDAGTGKFLRGFDPGHDAFSLAVSPDGKTIASGGRDRITISAVTSGKELARLDATKMGATLNLGFTPDGKSLVSVGEDAKVRIWDVAAGKPRLVLDSHGWIGRSMALSADGKTVAIGTVYNVVHVWDVTTGKELYDQSGGHDAPIQTVAYSPDGSLIVTGGPNQHISLWDAATFRPVRQLKGQSASQVSFSPDGRRLASVWEWNKSVQVWEVARGEKLLALGPINGERFPGTAFAPDGKTIVTASWRWNGEKPIPNTPRTTAFLSTWDLVDRKVIHQAALPGLQDTILAVSPDGGLAAVGGAGEAPLWLCDLKGHRQRLLPQKKENKVNAVAFSPDSRFLATGSIDLRTRLWEVATGREVLTLGGHVRSVSAVAFMPNGRVLASADGGPESRYWNGRGPQSIRFWDVATGQELAQLSGHTSDVTSLAFSRDGKRLVTGLSNGTALVWETPAAAKLQAPQVGRKLGPRELAALWIDLAGEDARVAHEAGRILAGSPDQSVPFLANGLRPAEKLETEIVGQRIADLGNEIFANRETAARELAMWGEDVEPELRKALAQNPSPEATRRIDQLLAAFFSSPPPERLRQRRGVWVLELIGGPAAREVLANLAKGDPAARLTREAKAALDRK